jgi:glycosyltransferase involved in cell wall biosynthesis
MTRRVRAEVPAVSVIVPAHNAGGYLARTLRSVAAQTLADLELIVVDDGSTDDTLAVARACARDDHRIRVVSQAQAGVAAARNRALSEARGAYVANIDADDLWRPTFLERCVGALESRGPGAPFAFARSQWIDRDDRVLPQEPIRLPAELDYRELLLRNPIGNGSAAVMRTAAVRECGGYDEAHVRRFRQGEDWLLQLQLSWRGAAPVIDEPLMLYRVWPGSTSHRVEESVAASLEVIRRCRLDGPRLDAGAYRSATSLMLLWNARRAWQVNDRKLALSLLVRAYASNPAWFTLPELRAALASGPRKVRKTIVTIMGPDVALRP